VNNDPVWVESTSPALTSVMLPARDIGLALARAVSTRLRTLGWPLDDLTLLAPKALLARASTSTLAIKDPRVLAAVTFIRANEGLGICVGDVCSAVGINRRSLELLFRNHLGHAPYASIQAARLEKARSLVERTTLPVTEIASHCHLPVDRFGALFRKHYGTLPLTLRRAERRSPR
jgi:transcriptional regulator GlxA family with amidase domain